MNIEEIKENAYYEGIVTTLQYLMQIRKETEICDIIVLNNLDIKQIHKAIERMPLGHINHQLIYLIYNEMETKASLCSRLIMRKTIIIAQSEAILKTTDLDTSKHEYYTVESALENNLITKEQAGIIQLSGAPLIEIPFEKK